MRWSYKTIHFELKKEGLLGSAFLDVSEIEEALNDYGRGGWELVSMIETGDGVVGILKHPIAGKSAAQEEDTHQPSGALQVIPSAAGGAAMKSDAHQSVQSAACQKTESVVRTDRHKISQTASSPDSAEPEFEAVAELTTISFEKKQQDASGEHKASAYVHTGEVQAEAVRQERMKLEKEDESNTANEPVLDSQNGDGKDDPDLDVGAIRIE